MGLVETLGPGRILSLLDWVDSMPLEKAVAENPKRVSLIVSLARKDPGIFCDFCFRDKGKHWRSAPFHHEWQAFCPEPHSGDYRAIFAPRAHAKTSQIVIGRTLWTLGHHPSMLIKIVCNVDDKAKKRVQELQANIERNQRLHMVFPHLQPDRDSGWEKHKFFIQRDEISREPTIEAYGILSGATGDRADHLIFDDVVDMKNAVLQPKSRAAVKESFRKVWLNLLGPMGTAMYIATPWHMDDLSYEVMEDPEWKIWMRAALSNEEGEPDEAGEPLWKTRWGKEALARRRRKIGDRAFQQQFQLKALSTEDATFSEDIIKFCTRTLGFGEWRRDLPIPPDWPAFMGVDPGASLGARNSPSAIMTAAVSPIDGVRYPLHILQKKMKFPELILAIQEINDEYHPNIIMGENNAFQEAVEQQLEKDRKDLPLKGHYTGAKKWDEFDGLPGLSVVMSHGGWVIPKPCRCGETPCSCHPSSCQCISCKWERELRYHPLWATADIVMAQWLCELACRAGAPRGSRDFLDLGNIWDEVDREGEK